MLTLLAPKRFCPIVPEGKVITGAIKRPATPSLGSVSARKGVAPVPQLSSRTTTIRGEPLQS